MALLQNQDNKGYANPKELERKTKEELGISNLTFEIYLILHFGSIFGRIKLKKAVGGGTDFGQSLQAPISNEDERESGKKLGGQESSGMEQYPTLREKEEMRNEILTYLKMYFANVGEEELNDIEENIIDSGRNLDSVKQAIKNISEITQDRTEIYQVLVALVNGDIREIQTVLGDRFIGLIKLSLEKKEE